MDIDSGEWSDLSVDLLLTESGILRGGPLFERAGIPEVLHPAEEIIERLAAVPGGSPRGRIQVLDGLLGESDEKEKQVAEIIADAARKLGALDWVVEEVLSEWQMSRWALQERLSGLERERQLCEERLQRLPDSESEAPRLHRAGLVAQEELAGLIAFLDQYRLSLRQNDSPCEDIELPAFAQTATVLRLLEKKQPEARKAA